MYTFTKDSFESSEAILKLTGSFPDNSIETCSSWSWQWLFLHGQLELFLLSIALSAETKTLPEWKLWCKKNPTQPILYLIVLRDNLLFNIANSLLF